MARANDHRQRSRVKPAPKSGPAWRKQRSIFLPHFWTRAPKFLAPLFGTPADWGFNDLWTMQHAQRPGWLTGRLTPFPIAPALAHSDGDKGGREGWRGMGEPREGKLSLHWPATLGRFYDCIPCLFRGGYIGMGSIFFPFCTLCPTLYSAYLS